MSDIDKIFSGSVPRMYETHLVPLIFSPYAADLKERVGSMSASRILEVAAGTGVVTRALAAVAREGVSIVATDLNQAMLDEAAAVGTTRPVQWQQADAMALPFPDGEFDLVVCQFGVMFFPDKPKAFSEARRVLKPGGVFVFNVWDRISENEFAETVTTALATAFPEDPPRFLAGRPTDTTTGPRSSGISRRVDSRDRRGSPRSRRAAGRTLPVCPRSRTARARHSETRSKRATLLDSAKRLTWPPRPSRGGSGRMPWMARSRRTSSPSKGEA
jgi:SAM-dependent methyltransferase